MGAALFFYSGSNFAEPTWHNNVLIKGIYPLSDGTVALMVDKDNPLCTSTSSPKYYHLAENQQGVTSVGFMNIYGAALSAASKGKLVNINFESSDSNCWINRIIVSF